MRYKRKIGNHERHPAGWTSSWARSFYGPRQDEQKQAAARRLRQMEYREKYGNRAYRKLIRHLKADPEKHAPRPEGLREMKMFQDVKVTPRREKDFTGKSWSFA